MQINYFHILQSFAASLGKTYTFANAYRLLHCVTIFFLILIIHTFFTSVESFLARSEIDIAREKSLRIVPLRIIHTERDLVEDRLRRSAAVLNILLDYKKVATFY